MLHLKPLIILFIIGLTVGSAFDTFLLYGGTTAYTNPLIFKLPWWAPLMWGVAGIAIGNATISADTILRRSSPMVSFQRAMLGMGTLTTFYLIAGFLPFGNTAKLVCLILGALLCWFYYDRTGISLLVGSLVGIIGCWVESTMVRMGIFHYFAPQIGGIPYWLFFLYFIGSITVGNLARWLEWRCSNA